MPFARGFGVWELVIILVIVMIIFGVGRLTEVGGAMGRAIKEFRKSQSEEVEPETPTSESDSTAKTSTSRAKRSKAAQ
ncbi:MAG: twin-arginine translocase TatA/TatE family subunit [Chloroflexi bacterium]|nr:twin-arginine translocase TatA/TatE family subunit [Chloroflexota bacterium]